MQIWILSGIIVVVVVVRPSTAISRWFLVLNIGCRLCWLVTEIVKMKISWNCYKTSKLAPLTSASAAPHSNSVCMFVSSSELAGLFWWAPAKDRESSTMWKSTVVDRWSCPCVRRHLSLLSTCPTSPWRFVAWLWPARCLRKEVYNWLERKCL